VVQALLFDASKPSDSIKPWNRGTADDSKYNRTVAYFSIVRPVFPLKTGDLMFVGFDSNPSPNLHLIPQKQSYSKNSLS